MIRVFVFLDKEQK